MRKLVLILAIFLLVSAGAEAKTPIKKKIPLPEEYGRVVISNYSEKAGLAPVVFDHWLHRSMFTCRLCHIDIGFAMKEDGSDIKAADNMKGFYCGTCHNGKKTYKGKAVFESCSNSVLRNDTGKCERCHLLGKKVKKEYDFSDFTEKFPKGRLGNRIDWEKAEDEGIIKPVDYIEGISAARPAFKTQKDINIGTKGGWMSEIIFSHDKHVFWNGCEVCHPSIFGVKRGETMYTMLDVSNGQYCGVCHGSVAFPLYDCQRCHIKPVQ